MGLFKKIFGQKEVVIDPANLTLPDVVPTSQSGLTLKKSAGEVRLEIEIVGESFRPQNVAAIAQAAGGAEFDIYLVAEPQNAHDKHAVAVYAANLHVGYIAKPGNKQWAKWVKEALERGELLWGCARAISREGTGNIGIFGAIMMPKAGKQIDELLP